MFNVALTNRISFWVHIGAHFHIAAHGGYCPGEPLGSLRFGANVPLPVILMEARNAIDPLRSALLVQLRREVGDDPGARDDDGLARIALYPEVALFPHKSDVIRMIDPRHPIGGLRIASMRSLFRGPRGLK